MARQTKVRIELHDLVLDHLRDSGFNIDSWKYSEYAIVDPDSLENRSWTHTYSVIPGLHRLLIVEKPRGGYIQFKGIPGFEEKFSIEDPDSLDKTVKILCDLYVWMKNINSECVKELLDESQGFCGGTDIRDS